MLFGRFANKKKETQPCGFQAKKKQQPVKATWKIAPGEFRVDVQKRKLWSDYLVLIFLKVCTLRLSLDSKSSEQCQVLSRTASVNLHHFSIFFPTAPFLQMTEQFRLELLMALPFLTPPQAQLLALLKETWGLKEDAAVTLWPKGSCNYGIWAAQSPGSLKRNYVACNQPQTLTRY